MAGKDDETGEDLIQRDDDKPESVRNRLEVFKARVTKSKSQKIEY